jgi:hypothetical protein
MNGRVQVDEWGEHKQLWASPRCKNACGYLHTAGNLVKYMSVLLEYMGKEEDRRPGQGIAPGEMQGWTKYGATAAMPRVRMRL